MERKVMLITGETIQVDDVPSHLILSVPGIGGEMLHHAQKLAERWLINGGCLVIGSDGVRLRMQSHAVPDAVIIDKEAN